MGSGFEPLISGSLISKGNYEPSGHSKLPHPTAKTGIPLILSNIYKTPLFKIMQHAATRGAPEIIISCKLKQIFFAFPLF